MAESICRALRDGALEGEHAPALTVKDSIHSPFGSEVFNHVLTQLSTNILAGKSQSRGLVLVALSRSPSFYADLLKTRGFDVNSSEKWFRILDCYTDPLGWKDRLMERGTIANLNPETSVTVSLCKDMRNLSDLFSSILELGKGLVGQGKTRFSVAIDSASEMLRYASLSSVAGLVSKLRSHDQVSCLFFLLHSDLHETRATSALEYLSSMLGTIEPMVHPTNVHRSNSECLPLLEQNLKKGKFNVRMKRRNGRVRQMCEEFCIEQTGIKFTAISTEDGVINQSLVPKVQFNLQLSEKERLDRAKVVLPFEHQGNGKPIQIYDGRQSINEEKVEIIPTTTTTTTTTTTAPADDKLKINGATDDSSGRGEIIYYRDSDDEMPDSDEDPDDDLDI